MVIGMRSTVQVILPFARAIYHGLLRRKGILYAIHGKDMPDQRVPMAFIIGNPRSGTTLLGRLIHLHPEVHYFREQYHLWQAIDPYLDYPFLATVRYGHGS